MADGFPSLEEQIAARRTGGPGEVIQSGLEGFMAGRKRRQEEDESRLKSLLDQARFRLSQQTEQREARTAEAGLIPADKSLTGQEATPQVQKELKPGEPEYDKTEIVEGGKKFLLFTNKADPARIVKVPAGDADKKGTPASIAASALKTAGRGFLTEVNRIEPKLQGFKTPQEQVSNQPTGPKFEGPLTGASARGAVSEFTKGQFGDIDPDITSFEQSRDTAGRRIYKELSGDVGNIAFNEGTFAKVLVPSIYDAPGLRKAKAERLQRLYDAADQARAKVLVQIQNGTFTDEQANQLLSNAINAEINNAITSAATGTGTPGATGTQIRILRRRPAGGQ